MSFHVSELCYTVTIIIPKYLKSLQAEVFILKNLRTLCVYGFSFKILSQVFPIRLPLKNQTFPIVFVGKYP